MGNRISKRPLSERHTQQRGWGREHWIENIPEYCGKILVIDPGKRGSLHFHLKKKETMMVLEGTLHLRLIDPSDATEYFEILTRDESILLEQGQVHQIINPSDGQKLVLIEFSTTHEEDDSLRVQKGD